MFQLQKSLIQKKHKTKMTSTGITKKITRVFFSLFFVLLASFFVVPVDDAKAECVSNDPTVIVAPDSSSGTEGDTIVYNIKIKSNHTGCLAQFFNLSFTKPDGPGNWSSSFSKDTVTLTDGNTTEITLEVTSEIGTDLSVGTYNFSVKATDSVYPYKSGTNSAEYVITSLACKRNPIVTITPSLNSGSPGQDQTYELKVKNDDSTSCANRTFDLSLLYEMTSCFPGEWSDDLEANTGSLAGQTTYTKNVVIASCNTVLDDTYTFTITATEGTTSGEDSADYKTALLVEDCVANEDEDSDGDINCYDSDCLGISPCCGDGAVTGAEGCDVNGNIGCIGSDICAGCVSCVSSDIAGKCVAGFDDCDCDGICEIDVSSDLNNCGGCGIKCGGLCLNGACLAPVGGIVPCSRMADNPATIWNEKEACKICHTVPLAKNIVDYLVGIAGLMSVLFIIIAGIISVTSMGSANTLNLAKTAASKSLLGFIIILVSWVIVNIGMVVFGFDDPMGDGSWKKFNCDFITAPVGEYCGDGVVQSPNSDGIDEACDPKETLATYQIRTGNTPQQWIEEIYACNPISCSIGCIGDPLESQIGEGCYLDINANGIEDDDECQKGRYICDFSVIAPATPKVICKDTFNNPNYRTPGTFCTEIFDECCLDGGAALLGMTSDFSIIRLPTTNITSCQDWDCYWPGYQHDDGVCNCLEGYSCDDICKQNGAKVCIGVGLMDVVSSYCVSIRDNKDTSGCSTDFGCNNSGNLQVNDCRSYFYTTPWTCDECADLVPPFGDEIYDFSVGETACYCK